MLLLEPLVSTKNLDYSVVILLCEPKSIPTMGFYHILKLNKQLANVRIRIRDSRSTVIRRTPADPLRTNASIVPDPNSVKRDDDDHLIYSNLSTIIPTTFSRPTKSTALPSYTNFHYLHVCSHMAFLRRVINIEEEHY